MTVKFINEKWDVRSDHPVFLGVAPEFNSSIFIEAGDGAERLWKAVDISSFSEATAPRASEMTLRMRHITADLLSQPRIILRYATG
jgi:hypothetical protein